MDKFIIKGGVKLRGKIDVSGAKNVAMKVILAGILTDKPLVISNVPLISSVYGTANIVEQLGVKVKIGSNHTLRIKGDGIKSYKVPLELGGLYRTATMVIGPLLSRFGKAIVPNPGGCRLGKRPIDRHINGLKAMGAKIIQKEGFFSAECHRLHGIRYKFESNSHTGTETLILAAILAQGETVLENAAEEPEVDNLILLLTQMGAKIKRAKRRTIVINGVKKLSGAEFRIMPDRNEVVTFAVSAIASGGDVIVNGTERENLKTFLDKLDQASAGWEPISAHATRFYANKKLQPTDVITRIHPGFMTDWQGPWAVLMTQADGISTIHETIFEDRFGYVSEIRKMGARIDFFEPKVDNPQNYYNFNWSDKKKNYCQAIKIAGPSELHDAILDVADLRAGATLVIGALIARGTSIIHGIDHIDRGYEKIEERLASLGADIKRARV
jgi:UDP-N-acetylglucosamine 1-carboxyvinyltransferase